MLQPTRGRARGDRSLPLVPVPRFSGRGEFRHRPSRDAYRGEWLGGLRHGQGVYRFGRFNAEYAAYRGEFRFDHAAGQGLFAFHSGAVLAGRMEDSRPHGQAQLLLPQGGRFVGWWGLGAWRAARRRPTSPHAWHARLTVGVVAGGAGVVDGAGMMRYSSGDRYVGKWASFQREGKGTYKWHSGAKFQGYWVGDHMHGTGRLMTRDGAVYDGEFQRSKRSGRGKMVFASGNTYEGEWWNDLMVCGRPWWPREGRAVEADRAPFPNRMGPVPRPAARQGRHGVQPGRAGHEGGLRG